MTREQAINYLYCSGFSEEQVSEIVRALTYEPTPKNDLGIDCISRKAAEDITWQDPSYTDPLNILTEVRDKIRELPSVTPQEPRWIPVSERLPKAGEYVGNVERYYLVQNEYGDMLVATYTHSGYWQQMYHFKPIGDEIVAWMPLPATFEQQESEGV